MKAIHPTDTIGQIVAQHPQLAPVFEELQIDYCCGGKRRLDEVCRERQFDVEKLLKRLGKAEESPADLSAEDWTEAPLAALCDDIVHTHHDYLRRELPRLSMLIDKVVAAHGEKHPELAAVQRTFADLRADLEPHMMKEECILFPSIRYLENGLQVTQFPFGSLANPIGVMVSDHDHAGDALATLRRLTNGYFPPAGACNTYRVMLSGLAELERDMHQHVHKENNILFPRAVELEERVGGANKAVQECGCHCPAEIAT